MGMAGVNYLVDILPWLYGGIGAYGSITGDRGGFLVGGLDAGVRAPLFERLSLEAGVFAGGGGGRSSLVGGGLMIRSHAGLLYDLGSFRLGAQYVMLEFPNGSIESDHFALIAEIPFTSLKTRSGAEKSGEQLLLEARGLSGKKPSIVRDFFGPCYAIYDPPSGVRNTDGITQTGQFSVVGFEYGRMQSDRTYLVIEASGAAGGDADGYAELLFGAGYRLPILEDWTIDGRLSLGSGGGGLVDTGGGALARASLGLSYAMTEQAAVKIAGGYIDAFRGDFRATLVDLSVTGSFDFLTFNGQQTPPGEVKAEELKKREWRYRASYQTYHSPERKQAGDDGPISLLGLKVDGFLNETSYLTGQALGAYTGGAGGYAVGLIGLGLRSPAFIGTGGRIFIELLAGASGGGGIDVEGGAIMQPMAGVSYDLGDWLSIEASAGTVAALGGGLHSAVYDAGIAYRFGTLNRK
jgi:hypothetical protein